MYRKFEKTISEELNKKRINTKKVITAFEEIKNNSNIRKHLKGFNRNFLYGFFTENNLYDYKTVTKNGKTKTKRIIKNSARLKIYRIIKELQKKEIIKENKALNCFIFV